MSLNSKEADFLANITDDEMKKKGMEEFVMLQEDACYNLETDLFKVVTILEIDKIDHLEVHKGKLLITSIIDNLLKGASGQAVQNMNIMFGLNERLGLDLAPLVP